MFLRNFQSKVLFNEHLLKLQCGLLLNLLGADRYDISVVCINKEEIQKLNRVYRNEDKPTDVLSFPYHEVRISDNTERGTVGLFAKGKFYGSK